MMFNIQRVVCPKFGTLCSGSNFDCYSRCIHWKNDQDKLKKDIARSRIDSFHEKLNVQQKVFRNWKIGEPCPECGANVNEEFMEKHHDFHYDSLERP